MGDAELLSPTCSSQETAERVIKEGVDEEQPKKKLKTSNLFSNSEKLELRLGGILCCAVCIDLPKSAVYQCTNGHLMCAGCFTHLLADARLRDETATCPNCRVEISRSQASRNLAVEKAVSELPSECQYCSGEYARNCLLKHEKEQCNERPCKCKYSRIGCPWNGPNHEVAFHESSCTHPSKTGSEVMEALLLMDQKANEEKVFYDSIFDLLSYEKISLLDLQLKPYRTDDFIQKLFYETSRFSAFSHQWVVKARINDNQRDPTQSCSRSMTYQVILKTKCSSPLKIHYLALKGPFGDMVVNPRIYCHEFSEESTEATYELLPLKDSSECNRMLASKAVNFRLIMFQVSK